MLSILGIPDYLGCVAGRFVALEQKASDHEELSKLQAYVLRKIRAAGGVALRLDPKNASSVLRKLLLLSKRN